MRLLGTKNRIFWDIGELHAVEIFGSNFTQSMKVYLIWEKIR